MICSTQGSEKLLAMRPGVAQTMPRSCPNIAQTLCESCSSVDPDADMLAQFWPAFAISGQCWPNLGQSLTNLGQHSLVFAKYWPMLTNIWPTSAKWGQMLPNPISVDQMWQAQRQSWATVGWVSAPGAASVRIVDNFGICPDRRR